MSSNEGNSPPSTIQISAGKLVTALLLGLGSFVAWSVQDGNQRMETAITKLDETQRDSLVTQGRTLLMLEMHEARLQVLESR